MIIEIIAFVAALWAMFSWGILYGLEMSAASPGPRIVARPESNRAANENAAAVEVTRIECRRASA